MARKQHRPLETSSMHSSKHQDVCRLLEDANLRFRFHKSDEDTNCTRSWDTAVMGRFVCHNPECATTGWSSKQIAMTIRLYPRREYNAKVYHQRCMGCDSLSKPVLDDTYAERVTYWLKKWCGIKQKKPPNSGKSNGPHQQELCEGCKAGCCSKIKYE